LSTQTYWRQTSNSSIPTSYLESNINDMFLKVLDIAINILQQQEFSKNATEEKILAKSRDVVNFTKVLKFNTVK